MLSAALYVTLSMFYMSQVSISLPETLPLSLGFVCRWHHHSSSDGPKVSGCEIKKEMWWYLTLRGVTSVGVRLKTHLQ